MSIKEEEMDSTMSKIFETLNLNSLSTEMHNLSLNELKSSLASLGKFVIVGRLKNQDESEAQTKTTEQTDAIESEDGAKSESDAVSQVKNNLP